MTTPTARSLAKLREDGWCAEKVEQRLPIPGRFVTRDMGGFADIIAWAPGRGILAVQATSGSNVSSHIVKLNDLKIREKAAYWLQAPARLEIWGWRKAGKAGQRKTWEVRVVAMQIGDDGELGVA